MSQHGIAPQTAHTADGDGPGPKGLTNEGRDHIPDNANPRARMDFVEPTIVPVVRTRRADP